VSEIVIHDGNWQDFLQPEADGLHRGLAPRDFAAQPFGSLSFARPFDLPLIDESDIPAMIAEKQASKSNLSDIRMRGMGGQMIPSRDQNGRGYCWAHSTTSAVILRRAADNQPYADLSAYAIACIIKNYRDQGGWGGESVEFAAERGIPTSKFWPQQSVSRSDDNPQTWADAAKHKVTEWMDLDPDQMEIQVATCLLLNIPLVVDLNWWSHSIAYADLLGWKPLKVRLWNSWGDSWSSQGMGILEGRKAVPSAALGLRVVTASAS
jgi:hypothetical protein